MDILRRVISSVGTAASDGGAYLGGATSVVLAGTTILSSEFPFILGEQLATRYETGGIWAVYNGKSYELLRKVSSLSDNHFACQFLDYKISL